MDKYKEEEEEPMKDYTLYLTAVVLVLMAGWMWGTARKRSKVWEAKKPVTWCWWFSVLLLPTPVLLAFELRRRWASASSESRSAISSVTNEKKEERKERKRRRERVNKSEHGKSTSAIVYINLYPIKRTPQVQPVGVPPFCANDPPWPSNGYIIYQMHTK